MKYKNLYSLLTLLALFLCGANAEAQSPWRANLNFNPRPTPYIDEWRSNGSIGTLTIFNPDNSPEQIIIFFQVMNLSTNKIMLRGRTSPQNVNSFPSPTVMSNTNFIGSQSLQYDEAQKVAMIRTGMLPEGEYSICLRLENMSHKLLIDNICSNFSISSVDPPQLISPQNNASLSQAPPSFNWTPVNPPSGGTAKYEIKIVEVLAGQSPSQALKANIALSEDRNINSPLFLLPPDKANFIKIGATYAWHVRAVDASGRSFARNDGTSDIYLFTVKSSVITNPKLEMVEKNIPLTLSHSEVKGTMKYSFADPFGKEGMQLFPLKNTTVRLVLRQFTKSGNTKIYYGNDSTVSKGKTDASGHFSFKTTYSDSTGQIGIGGQGKKNINNGDGQGLFREAFVIIDDIHYTSPENDIILEKGKTVDAGELHGMVKSFGLHVTVKILKAPYVMAGATCYLFRWKKMDNIPDEEGSPRPNPPEELGGTQMIGKVVTDNFGRADFGRMVQCFSDEQYLILVDPPKSQSGYEYPWTKYPDYQNSGSMFTQVIGSPEMNSSYTWPEYSIEISPTKVHSGVKGTLVMGFTDSKADKQPLKDVDLKLQIRYLNPGILPPDFAPESYPDNGKVVALTTTNSKGDFNFDFTDIPKPSSSSGVMRVYRLIVNDSRYSSPDDDITLDPGEIKNIGIVRGDLRTYTVVIHAQDKDQQPMPGTYVYARLPIPSDVFPNDEGTPHPNPEMIRSGELVVAVALTDENGDATLTRIGKGYHEHAFELLSDPTTGKNFLGFCTDDFSSYYGDGTEFNSQYIIPTYHRSVNMIPLPPAITGRVLREDNKLSGIEGAQIRMTTSPEVDYHPQDVITVSDKDGYYFIDGTINASSSRHVQASKLGYEKSGIANIPYLKNGEQSYNELYEMPKALVKGKVYHNWYKPETGYIGAWVTAEKGISVYTKSEFSLPTNLEEPLHLYFESEEFSYFPDTITTYSPHATSKDVGEIDLMKKLHRIKIVSVDEETNSLISSQYVIPEMPDPKYPGSVINPANLGADTLKWTPFESSDNYFPFTMYTNTDKYYEHRTYQIHNILSKDFKTYVLKTRKAGFISGRVYLYTKKSESGGKSGKNGKFGNIGQIDDLQNNKGEPVQYAKIRLVEGSSNSSDGEFNFDKPKNPAPGSKSDVTLSSSKEEMIAYSVGQNPIGSYTLGNIPFGKHTFKASKSKTGTVGDERTVIVTKDGTKNVDFYLRVYEDMDITQMLGFSMDVENLDSLPTGVFISGSLSELPSSEHFSIDPGTEIGFSNIKITPSAHKNSKGIPYPKPSLMPLVSDESSLPVAYHYSANGNYYAALKPISGNLKISAGNDEKGSVGGKVYIGANQFSSKISFQKGNENGFYLGLPNTQAPGNMYIPIITSDGKDAFSANPNGLNVVGSNGGSTTFTLKFFKATFDASNSWLRGDSVTLATTLDLPDISDANKTVPLSIGNVRLREKDIAISLPANASLPELTLDTWKMQGGALTFSGDNLSMDGVLKTGSVDVPFTGLPITPGGWKPEQAVFTLTDLSISSIIPLALNCPVKFGHDAEAKPPVWKLSSNETANIHAAGFAGIQGMKQGDSLYVKSFALTSLGLKSFVLQPNAPVHFYNYLTFIPASLSVVGGGVIEIKGDVYLNVTNGFNASNRILSVSKQNSVLVFDQQKVLFDIKDYYAKGTKSNYPVSGQTLNETGFFAKGELIDAPNPKAYLFPVQLNRNADSTAITILSQHEDGTTTIFPISKDGKLNISKVKGSMLFDNNTHQWQNMYFSGALTGASGASGNLSFRLSGAVQTEGMQKIGVTNIPTPFGNGSMTFNFATGAMHGAIDLDADLPGAGHMAGQADLEVDKDGWYFAACGDLQIKNPNIGIKAALILGSYPNSQSVPEITSKFDQLAWKPEVPQEMRTLPQAYNTLKGFYFCGECTNFLGITLPSIDVDLDPIVHCSVNFYYGAALSLGMNFAVGTQFDIGAAAFIGVDADAGGSIGIACGGGSLHAGLNMFGVGAFNTSTGIWSITGGSNLILSGELYAGWGVCSSSCGWYTCDKHTWGPTSMSFGLINFHAGSDGFKISY